MIEIVKMSPKKGIEMGNLSHQHFKNISVLIFVIRTVNASYQDLQTRFSRRKAETENLCHEFPAILSTPEQ